MKSNTSKMKTAVKWSAAALTVTMAAAQVQPATPTWVQPGVQVIYDCGASYTGAHPEAVTLQETTRVLTVNNGVVTGTTNISNPANPLQSNYNWTCTEGNPCAPYAARFWVDPKNATASIHGPNGETFTLLGQNSVTYAGKTWVGVMGIYNNPTTGVRYSVVYDIASGLILEYSETTPAQQIFRHLRSYQGN